MPMNPIAKFVEMLAWFLLVLLGANVVRAFQPTPLDTDSYQYISVAENLNHGRGLTTSLIYFDAERSHGYVPAPLTLFAPGYPVVLAIASHFGGDPEKVGREVSCVCFAGTTAFLAWGMLLVGVQPLWRQMVLLLFATNAAALEFAVWVMTEPLYMLFSTGAVVVLIWAEEDALPKQTSIARAFIGYSLAGLACWVRYAGYFLIAAVVTYALVQWILNRSRFRVVFLLTALVPVVLAAGLMLRNLVVAGNWKGGNEMVVCQSLREVLAGYARAQLHLFLGEHPILLGIWQVLLLVSGLGVAVLLIAPVRTAWLSSIRRLWAGWWRKSNAAALLVVLCVSVYSVGMFYAALRSDITFGARMFLPLLPLYLLLLGKIMKWLTLCWPQGAQRIMLDAGLLFVVVGYVGLNAHDLHQPPKPARDEVLAPFYATPAADGQPLVKWVDSNIGVGDTIMAADGQATGYLLHRQTLGMVPASYSPVRWECDEVKKQMKRFGVSYLILYKPSPNASESWLLTESHFAVTAVSQEPPCGFVIAAENSNVRILKLGQVTPL